MKGWFEKLAREEPTIYKEPAPGIHIQLSLGQMSQHPLIHTKKFKLSLTLAKL